MGLQACVAEIMPDHDKADAREGRLSRLAAAEQTVDHLKPEGGSGMLTANHATRKGSGERKAQGAKREARGIGDCRLGTEGQR